MRYLCATSNVIDLSIVRLFTHMKQILRFVLSSVILLGFVEARAQMTVDNAMTVQDYVTNVLLGQNITVSNITYNGIPANQVSLQVGSFQSNGSNMPISSGVIMSTGGITGAVGPNSQTGATTPTAGTSFGGSDPDLLSLVQGNGGSSINDWAIIEFDFVPLGDTLRFNYIWASEEYDGFVGSQYNDVFGFFISGPGISGPYQNSAQNIALIPGTSLNVGINNINNGNGNAGPCNYCEYYNQDSPSDTYFFNNQTDDIYTNPYYMQYDGYTDVLTARAIVQCGNTYHIKLAICDANDSSLDSGVFLQEDSFTSNIVVQVQLNFQVGGPNGNAAYEDCGENTMNFIRPESSDLNTTLVADIAYGGTATMGADYGTLPNQVIFNPGVSQVNVPIDIFQDNIPEGQENVTMTITNIAECSGVSVASDFVFYINDSAAPIQIQDSTYNICSGVTQLIEPQITGGYGLYHYQWSTGATTEDLSVTPAFTSTYTLVVSDTCGLAPSSNAYDVIVAQYPPLTMSMTPNTDQTIDCGGSVQFQASAQGGDSNYTYTWEDENGNTLWPDWADPSLLTYYSWSGSGSVVATVTDGCGLTAMTTVNVTLNAPPLVIDMPSTLEVNCGEQFTLTANTSGGLPTYYYTWIVDGVYDWTQYTNTYNGVASAASTIVVSVSDNCGLSGTDTTLLSIVSIPILIELEPLYQGNCTTPFFLAPLVTGGSGTYTYQWTNNGTFAGSGATYSFTSPASTQVSVNVTDGCGLTSAQTTQIEIVNPPITLDLGPDIDASCTDSTLIVPALSGGSGNLSYTWTVADTLFGYQNQIRVQSFVTVPVTVSIVDQCGQSATDNLRINIPNIPVTITATPDTAICYGQSAMLVAEGGGGEGRFVYYWPQYGIESDSLYLEGPSLTANYIVVVTDKCGKRVSDTITVAVQSVSAGIGVNNPQGDDYEFSGLTADACENCTYSWNFGDGVLAIEQNPDHTFDGLDQYTVRLTVIDSLGCTDESTYIVNPNPIFYIPNSFTPNNDGVNDVFQVEGIGMREFEITIFNRWGDQVYHSTDPTDVWMGDDRAKGEYYVRDGIYLFKLKVKGYKGEALEKEGTISVFR